jgi:predicted protein tyrosine phosphatase
MSIESHACAFCAAEVPVEDLLAHLDGCSRDVPTDAGELFSARIHDSRCGSMAPAGLASPAWVTEWYRAAAACHFALADVVYCPLLSSLDSVTRHAIIVLPSGPSYVCSSLDLSPVYVLRCGVVLYVGSEAAAQCANTLTGARVVGIVNAAIDSLPLEEEARRAAGVQHYAHLHIVDAPGDGNRAALEAGTAAVARIVTAAAACGPDANGRPSGVLVHCVAGVSRSVSLAVAFLMLHEGLTLREAATAVKAARRVAYPNKGFWLALRAMEVEARGGAPSTISDEAMALYRYCPLTALRLR